MQPTAQIRLRAVLTAAGVGVSLLLAGCSSSSKAPTTASSSSKAPAGASSSAPSASAAVASPQVPASALVKAGELSFCADISAPPLTYFDANQKAIGAEVDLGDALAAQLGLKSNWANTAFSGIIPALQAKQCDAILSQLFIKPARALVVDFVPYMNSSNTFVVKAGADTGITSPDTLCGHKVAGQTGTTIIELLQTASTTCTTAGKPAIAISQFGKDSEAFQQLQIGLVEAYGTTLETAAYVIKQQPGVFKTVGEPFNKIKTGIATRKDDTVLHDKIAAALAAIEANGKYAAILKQWNLSGDDITAG